MTKVTAIVKKRILTESIQRIVVFIFKTRLKKEKTIQNIDLPDCEKIVPAKNQLNDEFGYFNKIVR